MSLRICRFCGNKENLVDILHRGPEMLEKLSKCANIEIKSDDLMPKLICQHCDQTLDMSFKLRKQREAMLKRIQQNLKQPDKADEVHYVSDEEFVRIDDEHKEEKAKTSNCLEIEEITGDQEEFLTIDQRTLDDKTESTIIASETEDTAEQENVTKPADLATDTMTTNQLSGLRTDRTLSVDDIESNESYDIDMGKKSTQTNEADEIVIDDDDDDYEEYIDIGNSNDRLRPDAFNADANSEFIPVQEYCHIDMLSRPSSPTLDNEDSKETENELQPHSSKNPLTCVTCNEVFTNRKDYHEHIIQHGDNRYQCIQCLVSFPTRNRLSRHEATHTNGAGYSCPYCKRHYRTGYNLQRHITACHSKDSTHQCNICQLSYTRQDVLKRHMLQVHSNKKWHCKACGQSFRSAHLLNVHKAKRDCTTEHSSSKDASPLHPPLPPLPPECLVQGSDSRYKCPHCSMLFKTRPNFRNHLFTHENVRPFSCKTCPKAFRTRYALINHERIHSNERPFKCDLCSKSFRQITHMKHHRFLHTKVDMPFGCTTCNLRFVTKWRLRDHLRRHCRMKEFKCAECPEEFYLKYDLKRHARLIHHRSVDIVDSDNEGNQKNQNDVTEGTTETDRTEDEVNTEHEMNGNEEEYEAENYDDVIDIIDDDDDEDSNGLATNLLVLNEADRASPTNSGITTVRPCNTAIAPEIDIVHLDEEESKHAPKVSTGNITNKVENEPSVHYINLDEDESEEHLAPSNMSIQKVTSNEPIVNFIHLDDDDDDIDAPAGGEEFTTLPAHIKMATSESTPVVNEQPMDVIHLDEYEEENPAQHTLAADMHQDAAVAIESVMEVIHLDEEDSKQSFSPPQPPPATVHHSSEPSMDYIHLDASNSYNSLPRRYTNEYFDNIIEGDQEEYHTITEEKIQITQEKIETFTSYYNVDDIAQS